MLQGSYTKKYQDHVPCSFAYNFVCIDDKFTNPIVVYRGEKVTVAGFLKKLIDNHEEKIRDHCHVTGKFRGSADGSCNRNLQLTKKVPVIFHNLRGYDNLLIFRKFNKFDVRISVTPNGLEKYMVFFWIKT